MTDNELYEILVDRLNGDDGFCKKVVIPALVNSVIPMEQIFIDFKNEADFNRKAMGVRKLELADKKRIENLRIIKEWEQTTDNHFTVKDIPEAVMEVVVEEDSHTDARSFCSLMDNLFRWGKKQGDMILLNGEYHFNRCGMLRVIDGIWGTYNIDRELMWPWKMKFLTPDEDE